MLNLVKTDGVVDSFYVADALSRGARFDQQQAALRIAGAAVRFNAAATWMEMDARHPYNRNFINGMLAACAQIETACKGMAVQQVLLPHMFEPLLGGAPMKALREKVTAELCLNKKHERGDAAGLRICFRPTPYDCDLASLGPRKEGDLLVPAASGNGHDVVTVGQLFSSESRGLTAASQRIKHIWDAERAEPAPVQMDMFELNGRHVRGLGD